MIRSITQKPRRKRALSRHARALRPTQHHTLQHESLEARHLLATFMVSNLNDGSVAAAGDVPGSLRQAIFDANAAPSADEIVFQTGLTGTIALTAGELSITDALIITGPGAAMLTIDAQSASRVFHIDDGDNLSLSSVELVGMTITGGSSSLGGGIRSREDLTVTDSAISGNTASDFGGGIYNDMFGTLTVSNSVISGNSVTAVGGGGILNSGTATVSNSTITGNSAASGGGLFNFGTATVSNSTISGNSAAGDGGGIIGGGVGGGIYNFDGSVTVTNTIVAGNLGSAGRPGDIEGSPAVESASAFNLIGNDFTSGGLTDGTNGNIVGVDWTTVLENDGTNPTLADNGGLTQTIALLPTGPAVDAGDPAAAAGLGGIPEFDQRGPQFTRVSDGNGNSTRRLDIGAFEVQDITIAGYKWNDLNADGTWDGNEPGLNGWTIYLDFNNNNMLDGGEPTAITMNDGTHDGAYWFTDLDSGGYTVREVLMGTNWTQSYPGAPDFEHAVMITSGNTLRGDFEVTEPPNFGNFQAGEIHGYKWDDLNADGMWDAGEPGLNDWTIYLDLNDNDMLDGGEPTAITMNDGTHDGAFGFTDLNPGDYTVREVLPIGWTQSFPGTPDFEHAITITSGLMVQGNFEVAESPNFGNHTTGEIHGYKWHDLNGDGMWNAGEPGLNDWTIYLDLNNNDMLDGGEPTAITVNDGTHDGAYWFTDLEPGDYMVREVLPTGWTQSYPGTPDFEHPITITSGLIVQGAFEATESPNFGNYVTGEITGYKWNDLNGDGMWDAGEPGLNGWIIYLDLNNNDMLDGSEPTALTMNDGTHDGAYHFAGLDPGDYTVREVVPTGWTQSYPGTPDFEHAVTITSGLMVQGAFEATESPNFGNFLSGEIHGYKWDDLNGDGIWDTGEPGLNDWTVYLDLNNNDMLDGGEPTAITMNDGTHDGAYWFTDLVAGDYTVREVVPAGWTQTYPGGPDFEHLVAITPGLIMQGAFEVAESPNFGNYLAGEIHGYKWDDLNGDGVWDAGEPGLNDWTIYLDLNNNDMLDGGEPTAITVNDGTHDGAYWFTDLEPGDYMVREVLPTGWTQSYPGTPDFEHPITITSGLIVQGAFEATESPNFGNYVTGEITGYKWNDLNGDGMWDAGEPGLNGWVIYLDLNNNDMLDGSEPTALTMNDGTHDGAYHFAGLDPGDYTVREVVPTGWTQSYPGTPDFEHAVTITSGLMVQGAFEATESPNFGNFLSGEIHGYKWDDLNGDGIWDTGEPGLNDWTVYLDLNNNDMLDGGEPTAITMNDGTHDGAYWFTDLVAGDYTVREVVPAGWTQTYPGGSDFEHLVAITPGLIMQGAVRGRRVTQLRQLSGR